MGERMKVLLIVNPAAGQLKAKTGLMDIVRRMNALGCLVTVVTTQRRSQASELVRELAADYDRLVCCGGDGTLNEVIAGLMQTEGPKELGYIPAGTTNDFAAGLGLSKDLGKAAEAAVCGLAHELDLGSFNGRYFSYVASFGMFSASSYSAPQAVKNIFGHLAYVLEGATRLGSIQAYPLTVEHDGGVEEGGFCYGMVSNTVSVGGFKGMPAEPVRLDDGLVEVVLVRQPQNPLQLQAVIKALLTMSPDEGGLVTSFRTSRLRVACGQELPWTLDGEFGGTPAVAEIVNRQKAVTIVYGK